MREVHEHEQHEKDGTPTWGITVRSLSATQMLIRCSSMRCVDGTCSTYCAGYNKQCSDQIECCPDATALGAMCRSDKRSPTGKLCISHLAQ
eukprot:scaffold40201_cov27-Tisochrysis_lutea.AAC.1